jgi:divalent metal cation (Fe/Co/Zn/Cd) transporter
VIESELSIEIAVEMITTGTDRAMTARRGRRLEYFTIAWNMLEGLLSVIAGVLAGSTALVGFGIDSFIEVTSAGALLWRMSVDKDADRRERNERLTLRIVGTCFIGLAVYISVESIKTLATHEAPEHSMFGISVAVASLIAMPLLARAKRKVASSLGSAAMHADSRQTDFCSYLSAILLGGLVLNWIFDWWWADPVAALVMVPIITHEGIEGLRARACSDCHPAQ